MAWRSTSRAAACFCVVMSIGGCSPQIDEAIHDRTTCDVFADGDTGERSYQLVALDVPDDPNVGFDIDGRNSSEDSLTGCWREDGKHGVDAAFTTLLAELGPRLENRGVWIGEEIDRAVAVSRTEIILEGWNGTDTDECVGVRSRSRYTEMLAPSPGRLSNGVLEAQPGLSFDFFVGTLLCLEGIFCGIPSKTQLAGSRTRLVFAGGVDGMESVVGSEGSRHGASMIGGFVDGDSFKSALSTHLFALSQSEIDDEVGRVDAYFDFDTRHGCRQQARTTTSARNFSIALHPRAFRIYE